MFNFIQISYVKIFLTQSLFYINENIKTITCNHIFKTKKKEDNKKN